MAQRSVPSGQRAPGRTPWWTCPAVAMTCIRVSGPDDHADPGGGEHGPGRSSSSAAAAGRIPAAPTSWIARRPRTCRNRVPAAQHHRQVFSVRLGGAGQRLAGAPPPPTAPATGAGRASFQHMRGEAADLSARRGRPGRRPGCCATAWAAQQVSLQAQGQLVLEGPGQRVPGRLATRAAQAEQQAGLGRRAACRGWR